MDKICEHSIHKRFDKKKTKMGSNRKQIDLAIQSYYREMSSVKNGITYEVRTNEVKHGLEQQESIKNQTIAKTVILMEL